MRKIREALRLRFELKLGYQQIARSCAVTASMVHKYLKRGEAAGLSWPLPEGWDDARLEATLFPRPATAAAERKPTRTMPDFAAIHEQLRSSKYVTLQLLWEEYRQANPDGYGYSRFCELYQRWRSKPDVVLRQEHNLNSASAKIEEFAAEWLSTHPTKSTKLEARRHILEDARNPVRQVLRLALDGGVAVNRCSKPFPFCCEAPGFLQYLKEERGLRDTTIGTGSVRVSPSSN